MDKKILEILIKKRVNLELLFNCFQYEDDEFLLKYAPKERNGLYNYNKKAYIPLTIEEYLFLQENID